MAATCAARLAVATHKPLSRGDYTATHGALQITCYMHVPCAHHDLALLTNLQLALGTLSVCECSSFGEPGGGSGSVEMVETELPGTAAHERRMYVS